MHIERLKLKRKTDKPSQNYTPWRLNENKTDNRITIPINISKDTKQGYDLIYTSNQP